MLRLAKNRKGQGLVEYALLVAGVALVAIVGISVFGHKVADLISAAAVILPGAHGDDNAPIAIGSLIETTEGGADSPITLDVDGIVDNSGEGRLGLNLWGDDHAGHELLPSPGGGHSH